MCAINPQTALLALKNDGIKKRALDDLHTHLHGMGDFDFWVNKVVNKLLPELVYHAQNDDSNIPIEYFPRKSGEVGHANWVTFSWNDPDRLKEQRAAFSKAVEEDSANLTSEQRFTYDVVYSLHTLCAAFGIDDANAYPDKRDQKMQELQAHLSPDHDINNYIRNYRVYNARTQAFESRFGMTNADFVEKIASPAAQADKARKAMLINCFTMCGDPERVGGPSEFTTITDFRQHFTPQFYPRRYILKDDMYSQYPLVEDALLHYVLDRYSRAGVGYIELSVGLNDIISYPWMYRHLAQPSLPEHLRSTCDIPPLPVDPASGKPLVQVRFLAALNRVKNGPPLDKADDDARTHHMRYVSDFAHNRIVTFFSKSEKDLADIKKAFTTSRSAGDPNNPLLLHNMCVGLDYVGDEWAQPHCPFALPSFVEFLKTERQSRGDHFGFRYHCGEIYLPLGGNPAISEHRRLHMAISSAVIVRILTELGWTTEVLGLKKNRKNGRLPPPPLRIGHGIGFGPFIKDIPLPDTPSPAWKTGNYQETLDNPELFIQRALFYMRECSVPIEVNLTSNNYLAANCRQTQLLTQLLEARMTVVLSTDDDGIWPCECHVDGDQYSSVAAEFATAIAGTLTLASNKLSNAGVREIISNYPFARFGVRLTCVCMCVCVCVCVCVYVSVSGRNFACIYQRSSQIECK